MRWLALMLALASCSSSVSPEAACADAGGTCRFGGCRDGGANITTVDCNPERNPGGAACCPN